MNESLFTCIVPIITAIVVRLYRSNSVVEATIVAKAFFDLSSEPIRTKNKMREMMVRTMTIIPQKRPLLAREQST
jgi:hypothetical protein